MAHSVITRQSGKTKQTKHTRTSAKKRIGVKYCGGCNPGYERVEIIQRVQFRFNDRFLFLRHDEPDIEVIVLMSGCHRACASRDFNSTEIPYCSITGENDFDTLINWLKSLNQKGDF
jgi:hypothetical protein